MLSSAPLAWVRSEVAVPHGILRSFNIVEGLRIQVPLLKHSPSRSKPGSAGPIQIPCLICTMDYCEFHKLQSSKRLGEVAAVSDAKNIKVRPKCWNHEFDYRPG